MAKVAMAAKMPQLYLDEEMALCIYDDLTSLMLNLKWIHFLSYSFFDSFCVTYILDALLTTASAKRSFFMERFLKNYFT